MACACKANKELALLHKKYGHKVEPTYGEKLNFYTIEGIKHFMASLVIVMITPILFLYVMYVSFFTKERKISVSKLFRLK